MTADRVSTLNSVNRSVRRNLIAFLDALQDEACMYVNCVWRSNGTRRCFKHIFDDNGTKFLRSLTLSTDDEAWTDFRKTYSYRLANGKQFMANVAVIQRPLDSGARRG